jgi:hypothetical protein
MICGGGGGLYEELSGKQDRFEYFDFTRTGRRECYVFTNHCFVWCSFWNSRCVQQWLKAQKGRVASQYSNHVSRDSSPTQFVLVLCLLVWFSIAICAALKVATWEGRGEYNELFNNCLWRVLYVVRKHELIYSRLAGREILNSTRLYSRYHADVRLRYFCLSIIMYFPHVRSSGLYIIFLDSFFCNINQS